MKNRRLQSLCGFVFRCVLEHFACTLDNVAHVGGEDRLHANVSLLDDKHKLGSRATDL